MMNKRAGLWAKGIRPGIRKICIWSFGLDAKGSGRFGAVLVAMESYLHTDVIYSGPRSRNAATKLG
jgi:hypothetical protein